MRFRFVSARQSCQCRPGVAAAELAFILPVFVTLILGAIDFGRFAYNYIAVINAARNGAAYGMMNNFTSSNSGTWSSKVTSAAQDEMNDQVGTSKSNVSVTVTSSTDANGLKRVQVSASYPFTTVVNWRWTGLGIPNSLTLRSKIEMRLIR
jgi:Flp pilus assembly protein TadG